MSSKNAPNTSKETAPIDEVEYWRSLVYEQQQLIEKLEKLVLQQKERIDSLEASIRAQKKLKGKPKLRASLLNQIKEKEEKYIKRAGSAKDSKKNNFEIDEERIIQPSSIPLNASLNGYRTYDVQEIEIRRHNIRFRLAEYLTDDGKTVVGELPPEYRQKHYGPKLISYIMYQHYQCRVPQPLIYEQLQEWGIEISEMSSESAVERGLSNI